MAHFVDTSALYALLDRADPNHGPAANVFPPLLRDGLVTHNYVVVESLALLDRRCGRRAALALVDETRSTASLELVSVTCTPPAPAGAPRLTV